MKSRKSKSYEDNPWGWQGPGKPLRLSVAAKECVQCGWCCSRSPCSFGKWNDKVGKCYHLIPLDNGRFSCAIYQEILDRPTDDWAIDPAFGAGCCSSLNPRRAELLQDGDLKM